MMDYNDTILNLQKTLGGLSDAMKDMGKTAEGFTAVKTIPIKVLGVEGTAIMQKGHSVHIVFEKGNASIAEEIIKRVNDKEAANAG